MLKKEYISPETLEIDIRTASQILEGSYGSVEDPEEGDEWGWN